MGEKFTFEEILDAVKKLKLSLEEERLMPEVVRMPYGFRDVLLQSEEFSRTGIAHLLGLEIRAWDDDLVQVETSARFGHFRSWVPTK